MGAWFEEIPEETAASGRKVYEIKESPQPERFNEYRNFVKEMCIDPVSLKDPYEFANSVRSRWLTSQEFQEDLSRLLICLLIEVRRERFIWGYPGTNDMEYMDALYSHIKSLMP